MNFTITPFSAVWDDGIFTVPKAVADKYLKMASGKQMKALLFILAHKGKASSSSIAKALGVTSGDVDELMEFWIEEGVLEERKKSEQTPQKSIDNISDTSIDVQKQAQKSEPRQIVKKQETAEKALPKRELLPAPRLTPKDIVNACRDNKQIDSLLNEAQVVLRRTISFADQEMLVNMVNYYGLKPEVILMLLTYYRSEKEKGKSIGISYINKMADNWAEEGIVSAADADKKLLEIENTDKAWDDIVQMTGISHRTPTIKQRQMIKEWTSDFSYDMINAACDIMKENADKPSIPYVNSILKKWKKNGVKTLADIAKEQQEFEKSKQGSKKNRSAAFASEDKPSYDIDQIEKDVMNNTDIKF